MPRLRWRESRSNELSCQRFERPALRLYLWEIGQTEMYNLSNKCSSSALGKYEIGSSGTKKPKKCSPWGVRYEGH
jgi:hypothetical protein